MALFAFMFFLIKKQEKGKKKHSRQRMKSALCPRKWTVEIENRVSNSSDKTDCHFSVCKKKLNLAQPAIGKFHGKISKTSRNSEDKVVLYKRD